jgi:hypothetical protein
MHLLEGLLLAENSHSPDFTLPIIRVVRRERELWGSEGPGAKMGQTIRQSMPFNAHYAFVQPIPGKPRSQ